MSSPSRTIRPAGAALLRLLVLIFLCAVLVLEAYAIISAHSAAATPLSESFGNFDRVRARLEASGDTGEFSFAVAGDVHSSSIFEKLRRSLRTEPLSFLMLLGDTVHHPTPGYRDFLRAELVEEPPLPFPIFCVVGNHDVDPRTFPVSRFEETFGPTNFAFEYRACLFIVLRVLPKPAPVGESLAFLEPVLKTRPADCRRVFVFTHCPLMSFGPVVSPVADAGKFIELFDRYKVDYVVCGHQHSFARTKVQDTVYLVSGGAGGKLDPTGDGSFHHAVVLTVAADKVSEKVVRVPAGEELEDRLERFAVTEAYPLMEEHPVLAVLGNVAVLLLLAWVVRGLAGRRRKPAQPDSDLTERGGTQ